MHWKKRLGKELFFFALAVVVSFLFWFFLAIVTEQHIVAQKYLYDKEKYAFVISIGLFYFIRVIALMAR